MCEQCLTNPYYYGPQLVLDKYTLIRARRDGNEMNVGEWGLVLVNDPSVVFKTTPIIHKNDAYKTLSNFYKFSDEMVMDIMLGYDIIARLKACGYVNQYADWYGDDETINPVWDLYVYLSEFIEKSVVETEEDPFTQRDKTCNHNYNYDPKKEYNPEGNIK